MKPEPTPRQVLYALVAGGFVVVTAVLAVGAASAGLVPTWWSATLAALIGLSAIYVAVRWRRTGQVLMVALGVFVIWMVGTLILAS